MKYIVIITALALALALTTIFILLVRNNGYKVENTRLEYRVDTMYTINDILTQFYVYQRTKDTVIIYSDVYSDGKGGELAIKPTAELPELFEHIYLRRDSTIILPRYTIEEFVQWLRTTKK